MLKHSIETDSGIRSGEPRIEGCSLNPKEREFFIDNLLVQIVDRPHAMGGSIPFSR